MHTILVVDDEKNIRSSLAATFRLEGYAVTEAADGPQGIAAVERGGIDAVVLDLQMPGLDGMETLARLRHLGHSVPVVFLTAHGTIDLAVAAVRLGAFDFIEKPPQADRILLTVANALRQADLEQENRELRGEAEAAFDMIGSSAPMRELFEQLKRVAPTEARVLVLGENGTGKELIARRVGALVAAQHGERPAHARKRALFGVLDPRAELAERNVVLGLARHGARVTPDAPRLVDDETQLHEPPTIPSCASRLATEGRRVMVPFEGTLTRTR